MGIQNIQGQIRRQDNGNTFVADIANGGKVAGGGVPTFLRRRCTAAEVNAGVTLVSAPGAGYALRMLDCALISVGGAAAGATTVDVLATLAAASRKLIAAAVAGLTQSTVLRAGAANSTVLADGASHTANDPNTAITLGKTGASLTGSTNIDVQLAYVIDEV